MYLVHIYAYPYKYTYIQVLMAQNSCISQPYFDDTAEFSLDNYNWCATSGSFSCFCKLGINVQLFAQHCRRYISS